MDYYLSFPTEAAAKAVLYRIEGAVEADPENGIEAREGTEVANYTNIDTIGVIYKPTGETIEQEGITMPVMKPLDGWHVNVRLMFGEDADALKPYAVAPRAPVRVWG